MEIIKNRPIPNFRGRVRWKDDPANLMEVGDSVSFTDYKPANALVKRLQWRHKKGTVRHFKETNEYVVWRTE